MDQQSHFGKLKISLAQYQSKNKGDSQLSRLLQLTITVTNCDSQLLPIIIVIGDS